jgi:hypothetical protein
LNKNRSRALSISFRGQQVTDLLLGSSVLVQIFDSLVERKVNFESDLSSDRIKINSTNLNESLIPAQNQRWRRA